MGDKIILFCVDPDLYTEYGSGSTKLPNTDPIPRIPVPCCSRGGCSCPAWPACPSTPCSSPDRSRSPGPAPTWAPQPWRSWAGTSPCLPSAPSWCASRWGSGCAYPSSPRSQTAASPSGSALSPPLPVINLSCFVLKYPRIVKRFTTVKL